MGEEVSALVGMKILVINGPNLNMLGKRNKSYYGDETLAQIETRISARAKELDIKVDFFQSNHEGAIVDYLQTRMKTVSGIIINPGALTHYGLSLRDALEDTQLPVIEVHLSDIDSREEFRQRSVISPIAIKQIKGMRGDGYILAIESLASHQRNGGEL